MSQSARSIDTLLDEPRTFAPSAEFRSRAKMSEAAVVAKNDPETAKAISAFVTPRSGYEESTELIAELRHHVGKLIGPIARPNGIAFTPDLPKGEAGRSCAVCSATSPRTASSAIPRRSPMRRSSRISS